MMAGLQAWRATKHGWCTLTGVSGATTHHFRFSSASLSWDVGLNHMPTETFRTDLSAAMNHKEKPYQAPQCSSNAFNTSSGRNLAHLMHYLVFTRNPKPWALFMQDRKVTIPLPALLWKIEILHYLKDANPMGILVYASYGKCRIYIINRMSPKPACNDKSSEGEARGLPVLHTEQEVAKANPLGL